MESKSHFILYETLSCISLKVSQACPREVLTASKYLEDIAKRAALEGFTECQANSVVQQVKLEDALVKEEAVLMP
jgi:hypothetical protein